MELAANPLNTYWYVPSSIQLWTRKTLNIRVQGRYWKLPVSGQSWNALMYKWACICAGFHMHFACAVKRRRMQPHMSELKEIIHNTYGVALQLGVKANAPEHMAPAWHFLSPWTLADSLQNVTAVWPTVNVWMGHAWGEIDLLCLSKLFIENLMDVNNAPCQEYTVDESIYDWLDDFAHSLEAFATLRRGRGAAQTSASGIAPFTVILKCSCFSHQLPVSNTCSCPRCLMLSLVQPSTLPFGSERASSTIAPPDEYS